MEFLVLYILLTFCSQILIKKASVKLEDSEGSYLIKMYKNPSVLIAYGISFFNLFVWILALRENSLSLAVLSTSSTYIIAIFIDKYFFNEKLSINKITGAFLITLGIIINAIGNG